MTLMAVDLDANGKPKNGWWKTAGELHQAIRDT